VSDDGKVSKITEKCQRNTANGHRTRFSCQLAV